MSDFTGPLGFDRAKGSYALSDAEFFELLSIPQHLAKADAAGRGQV